MPTSKTKEPSEDEQTTEDFYFPESDITIEAHSMSEARRKLAALDKDKDENTGKDKAE